MDYNLMIHAGLLGAGGQLARVLIGVQKSLRNGEKFQTTLFFLSMLTNILLGFMSACLVLCLYDFGKIIGPKEFLLLVGAGYGGVDILEGLLGKTFSSLMVKTPINEKKLIKKSVNVSENLSNLRHYHFSNGKYTFSSKREFSTEASDFLKNANEKDIDVFRELLSPNTILQEDSIKNDN